MADQYGEKTQDPTPHRRQKAREEGQVAKSQDLGSAVLLILGPMTLLMLGGGLVEFLGGFTRHQLGGGWLLSQTRFSVADAVTVYRSTLSTLSEHLLPILLLLFLGAVAVNVLQIGFLFLPQKLIPDITRLDPLKGLQRLFSLSGAVRLTFGLFKIAVIAVVAFLSLYDHRDTILALSGMGVGEIAAYLVEILLWTAIKIGIALLVLAILDYGFQKWKYEQDIKMTTQEIREEMKNLEGSPEVIARRKMVQRQLALNRLSNAVPKADMVIANPTELAVAVQYQPETMAAPTVVAKGGGVLAQRIRKLALERGIPIVERKPLAQALYREVNVDQPVPEDKYAAVAEVLAYVYQLQGKTIPNPPASAA